MGIDAETAVLAGGCFWGVHELMRSQPGVVSSRAGWTGGDTAHPTEAEPEDQHYLQKNPDGEMCHFPRPGWQLPRREAAS